MQTFDYVIAATGHFAVQNIPSFPGIDKFPGRVLHSHSFRDASHFKDKFVLVLGSSLSAEGIALQCLKYGAKSIVYTWKTKPIGFSFPPQITGRPLLTKIEGSTTHFKDGSSTEVDDIILCTGCLYSFPILEDDLCLKTVHSLYHLGLYKGICCTQGGTEPHASVCLSGYLSICLPVYPSVCLCVCLFVFLSVYLAVCLSVHLSICLPDYLSFYLSVYLSPTDLARVVRKVDNAIHRINHYPVDSAVCFVNTYPLDSDLSGG